MKKGKERIIYDNYDLWETYSESAIDALVDMWGDEYTDDDVWNMIYDFDADDYSDEIDRLREFFSDGTYIIFGTIGRWCGCRTGFDVFDDFESAYNDAIKDCDFIKIYDVNGHFYIECSHHDGTNYYEIKKLTDAGVRYYTNWDENWSDKRSNNYVKNKLVNRYSVLPRFAEKVYGCNRTEYVA